MVFGQGQPDVTRVTRPAGPEIPPRSELLASTSFDWDTNGHLLLLGIMLYSKLGYNAQKERFVNGLSLNNSKARRRPFPAVPFQRKSGSTSLSRLDHHHPRVHKPNRWTHQFLRPYLLIPLRASSLSSSYQIKPQLLYCQKMRVLENGLRSFGWYVIFTRLMGICG